MRSKVCSEALTQRVLRTLKTAVRRENGIISIVIRPASTMAWLKVSRSPRGDVSANQYLLLEISRMSSMMVSKLLARPDTVSNASLGK
jgi:hypothetical protein